ncbi:histidine kinase (plasmid) [Vibrio sp. qd031]|nr:histidine kinase [Vibrio sp. qd031]
MIQRLLIILCCLPSVALASMPQKLETLMELFNYEQAIESYDIHVIQSQFPTHLISPESLLPQTSNYPLKDLQKLYSLAQKCTGRLPMSPLTTEALVFTRALCNGTDLPERWFARSGLIHPGGGSFAARYVVSHPELAEDLQDYMHVSERAHTDSGLLGRLQLMTEEGIRALLAGSRMIMQGEHIWIRKGERYFIFPQASLDSHAKTVGLNYSLLAKDSNCLISRGNLCWFMVDDSNYFKRIVIILVVINIISFVGWGVYRWNSKRDEMRSRMLVLQILTHELRTPIASLSMTVEGFRREFEALPESVYDEFRRLCEDSRRLRQLAEASKDYLQSDNQPLAVEWLPSLKEWMDYKVEEYEMPVTLSLSEDRAVRINIYWLGTCIDNLVSNALKYGEAPVEIKITTENNRLRVEVIDGGNLSKKDWNKLKQPFVSKSGLGLGLTIVNAMVNRMGGTMKLIGPPTNFIVEIPCETDVASC